MKSILGRLLSIIVVCCAASLCVRAQTPEPPLTNTAVIKLVRAGFKEKTVIAIIHSRANQFKLDPDRLIELKRSGVSENIILAMLSQDEAFALADDDWMNDSNFGRGSTSTDGDRQTQGGADIFGGSTGSKGQTRSRGGRGSNEGQTATTGSATVRIIRPPSEAGGESLKLEKTPILNNESVIKLVEAGFSEGTIIKRIEDSPADFDLSSPKLEELRRRRVTESIIAAMTAAMSDGSDPKQDTPAKTKGN